MTCKRGWRALTIVALVAASWNSSAIAGESPCVAPAMPPPRFAVGIAVRTFVDHSRGTPAHGTEPPSATRVLETVVLYPAAGPARGNALHAAPPLRTRRRFPLIVRAHGLGGSPSNAIPLMRAWASSGYVVAMPKFPLSNADASGGPSHDYLEQARDIRFVLSQMLHLHGRDRALRRAFDAHRLGLSGYSDGAATVLATAYESCCRNPRVRAVVATAGAAVPVGVGSYRWTIGDPPLLLVRGDADPGYSSTVATFDAARGPRELMTLSGAPHQLYVKPWRSLVVRSELAFFDRWLARRPGASHALRDVDACSPLAALRSEP